MVRYGKAMIDDPAHPATVDAVEASLRETLARDEAMAGTVGPILQYLLANGDNSAFSEEIVARVRGMADDIVAQLLDRRSQAAGIAEPGGHDSAEQAALRGALIAHPALLCHLHATALEWQLAERLQARLELDPVLPPLLQALVASSDEVTAGLAMQSLASQARFCQAQRRMRLALGELPGDLLHIVLLCMRVLAGTQAEADAHAAAAEAAIRDEYDESLSRLGLISRLVTGMGGGAVAALSIGHAGSAIFLTAVALSAGQDRDAVTLATSETQSARLAVLLRAAGLKPSAIEEQFLAIHPDTAPPVGLDRLAPDRAAELLAAAGGFAER